MRPDAPLCGAVRFEGSAGCALNAGHIERGQPDHLDTCGNRWATVSPADTEPPVDEDARELAQAYERGRADATRDAAGYLRLRGWCVDAAQLEEHEREHRAGPVCAKCESAKQGAASS